MQTHVSHESLTENIYPRWKYLSPIISSAFITVSYRFVRYILLFTTFDSQQFISKNIIWNCNNNKLIILGALLQVSQAAAHANDSMKRIEQFKKLLEVQESIGGSIDLVSPTREVLKEGKIVKISARTGDHQDRYLFLVRK